jgi:hypothetical protein
MKLILKYITLLFLILLGNKSLAQQQLDLATMYRACHEKQPSGKNCCT